MRGEEREVVHIRLRFLVVETASKTVMEIRIKRDAIVVTYEKKNIRFTIYFSHICEESYVRTGDHNLHLMLTFPNPLDSLREL